LLSHLSSLFPYTTLFRSLATVDISMIDQFIQLLNTHETIALFGYSSSLRAARSLQEGLLLSEKVTYMANNDTLQRQLTKELDERSEEHTSELQSRFDLVC